MNKIQTYRNLLERQKGQKVQIENTLNQLNSDLRENQQSLLQHEQAREIIRNVGLQTQQSLEFHISDIVSMALDAVFPEPYELKAEFIQRRNKTECDLWFVRDEEKLDPLSASGGGAVDVAAFALRIASWSMMRPRTRNTIILDEPLRFLSVDLHERASEMIKQISRKLGIQFIIVSHNETLTSYADKVFEVSIKKGISHINSK